MVDNTSCHLRSCNKCDEYRKRYEELTRENEYLRMRLAEIRDKVDQMEPEEGFPPVYNRGYSDSKEEIRRIVS